MGEPKEEEPMEDVDYEQCDECQLFRAVSAQVREQLEEDDTVFMCSLGGYTCGVAALPPTPPELEAEEEAAAAAKAEEEAAAKAKAAEEAAAKAKAEEEAAAKAKAEEDAAAKVKAEEEAAAAAKAGEEAAAKEEPKEDIDYEQCDECQLFRAVSAQVREQLEEHDTMFVCSLG